MRKLRCPTLWLLLVILLCAAQAASAQTDLTTLQTGIPVERALTAGQSHTYGITLEQDQFLQLVVDQRGIDIVVRVFSPAGRRLGEFDTPNGTDGPEQVTVIAATSGVYRIEVAPLAQSENPRSGRYEIKVVELRKATEQELQAHKDQATLKTKGLALLTEVTQNLPELHQPNRRAGFQIQAAQLLWSSDEKRATKLMEQAIESVKEFIAGVDTSEREYYESYQIASQLRQQVVEALAPHDPEMALNFLRSTRTLANPGGGSQGNQELQLELSLASQIAATDPKRAFQLAEDSLKTGTSTGLLETLSRLRDKDPQLASRLAHDITAKLLNQRLLKHMEAAYLAGSFLHMVRPASRTQPGGGDAPAFTSLVSEDEFRDLFQKILSEVLAYSPPTVNAYPPERNVAQNLLNTLKQMSGEMTSYAPDRATALEKKSVELNNLGNSQSENLQRYQTTINGSTPDAALESVEQAPREMRDQLYYEIAERLAIAGDSARARQVIVDHIINPVQRQRALKGVEQRTVFIALTKGKIEDALRTLSNVRPLSERAQMLSQAVSHIGPGLKRSTALQYLEQARNILGPSAQAEDQNQMYALLAIGRAFSRYDATRAFEIVEPLVDQFNEISASALVLNGFGQTYFQEGEVIINNGNVVGETANQMATTLSALAQVNFDRAKAAAQRMRLLDVRIQVYLAIAQQTIQPNKDADQE
ncbi:MAG: hypothetical protein QOH71_1309 [Blastocatellia bacterium]|jgi:hypothetical protein|nr:hypothetical protein [Blastocatellia bacterium]